MNLSDLLKEGKIKEISRDRQQAKECLEGAAGDIRAAKKLIGTDPDWTYSISYNSMLRSARAMMFLDGYAPAGENHHKTAIDYADVKFGKKHWNVIDLFGSMRKKRHRAVYDRIGAISKFEAENAVKTAEELLEITTKKARIFQ